MCRLLKKAFGGEHDDVSAFEFDSALSDKTYDPTEAARLTKQQHRVDVYKGLAAVMGVYAFFLVESLLKLRHAKNAKVSYFKKCLE